MDQTDAAFRRALAQLRDGAGRVTRILEELPNAAGLVGGDHQPLVTAHQLDEPIGESLHAARQGGSGGEAGVVLRVLLERLAGLGNQLGEQAERGRGLIGERPFRWQLARCDEALPPLDGLAIEVAGDG